MTPRCRLWVVIKRGACCFSGSEQVWAPLFGHLPYKKGTYEDYVGLRGLKKRGKKKWRKYVFAVVECLKAALEPEEVVLGGGNVKKLKELPPGCRAGDNFNAFRGGFRLWNVEAPKSIKPPKNSSKK
jgi:polyphosphate glucokinase